MVFFTRPKDGVSGNSGAPPTLNRRYFSRGEPPLDRGEAPRTIEPAQRLRGKCT